MKRIVCVTPEGALELWHQIEFDGQIFISAEMLGAVWVERGRIECVVLTVFAKVTPKKLNRQSLGEL